MRAAAGLCGRGVGHCCGAAGGRSCGAGGGAGPAGGVASASAVPGTAGLPSSGGAMGAAVWGAVRTAPGGGQTGRCGAAAFLVSRAALGDGGAAYFLALRTPAMIIAALFEELGRETFCLLGCRGGVERVRSTIKVRKGQSVPAVGGRSEVPMRAQFAPREPRSCAVPRGPAVRGRPALPGCPWGRCGYPAAFSYLLNGELCSGEP